MFFIYFLFVLVLNSSDNFKEIVQEDYNYTKAVIENSTDLIKRDVLAQEFIDKYGEDNFYSYEFIDYIIKRCIRNKKMGFCYTDGKTAIEFVYDYAGPFHNGYAMVEEKGKIGFVDVDGNFTIPLKYDWGSSFYFGIAEIKYNGKDGYVDLWGNELFK